MPPKTPLNPRLIVLTASIAAITATGAWYGAGLKTEQEFKKERKARLEATPEEKIARLEDARVGLTSKRFGLVRKIDQLHERKNAQADAVVGNGDGGVGKG